MWQVVYIAPNQAAGEMVKDLLTRKGFLVMLRPAGVPQEGGGSAFEVLVPAIEAGDATEVLSSLLAMGLRDRRR